MRTGAELAALTTAATGAREVARAVDEQARAVRVLLDGLAEAAGAGPAREACAAASRALPRRLHDAARTGATLADGALTQHALLLRAGGR